MKNVKRDEWQFELNGKTWNLFNESDAEAFGDLIDDAERYRWLRANAREIVFVVEGQGVTCYQPGIGQLRTVLDEQIDQAKTI